MLLTGCLGRTPEPTVVVQTEYQKQNIPIQARPPKVEFPPVEWSVITEDNIDVKMEELKGSTGNFVVFAVGPKGYENLAIGIGELRRYINEQKAIIVYYEDALKNK
jgi:hypothetical protein